MDNNRYAQIELYLAGELTGEELAAFTAALRTDPELARAVEEYREADAGFNEMLQEDETRAALSLQLKQLGKQYCVEPAAKPAPVRRMRKWWAAAAAAAAVFCFFMARLLFFGNPSLQKLYSANYEPVKIERDRLRTLNNKTSSLLNRADSFYLIKQYNKAIPVYRQYLAETDSLAAAALPLATAYLENNQHDSAAFYFNRVATESPVFKNEATWYLAMIKLKEKDREACRRFLQQIKKDEGLKYFEQAQKLLRKL
jgi:hypothetical protein